MNIQKMMKQAQKMQKEIERKQEELADERVEFSSGGGVVKAIVNGRQELLELSIAKDVVDPEDIEMLQDLIISAINGAMQRSNELMQEQLAEVTGGLGLPTNF
ncbi:MAG: YbaB/EbfC family nucleoid-associated protein [Candidatus Zixiibacteriota bacterium]